MSQITGVSIVSTTIWSGVDQRKYQSLASLAIVRGIHRWPVDSPHKRPVTRKMFPFDDVFMQWHSFVAVPMHIQPEIRIVSSGVRYLNNFSFRFFGGLSSWPALLGTD